MSEPGKLVEAAGRAANAGRWQEAEALWQQVLALEPSHPQALCSLGIHALQRGDAGEAQRLLTAARERAPQDFVVLMALTQACRQRGDAAGEREAIDAALTVDAYFLPALLAVCAMAGVCSPRARSRAISSLPLPSGSRASNSHSACGCVMASASASAAVPRRPCGMPPHSGSRRPRPSGRRC